MAARDARFDGRFFTGVTSTGIYCRPICPARTPARRNVRFYAHAAAAESAGFRACRRCRPEAGPGTPQWDFRGDLVGRALRLIADGVADEGGVVALARRLAVTERHLHRLFVAELGVGPQAVARTRRLQLARRLLRESALPVTDVAFASGFGSVRQFNAAFREAYGMAPGELRGKGVAPRTGAPLELRLAYRPPYDVSAMLGFLTARAMPGLEEVGEARYARVLRSRAGPAVVELTFDPLHSAVHMRLTGPDVRGTAALVAACRRLLDLDADPQAIAAALGGAPALGPLLRDRPGLRLPGTVDGFELAVRAVLGQQVSVAAARTLGGRLVARLGEPLSTPVGTLTHAFPGPEAIAADELDGLGLTGARRRTLRGLAEAVADGRVRLDGAAEPAEVSAALTALAGIGPWTASYVALRALRDPDAFPIDDLGLKKAMERLGVARGDVERWRPWRAYAAQHLWTLPPEPVGAGVPLKETA
ncbi:MAG: helix-turn-helix domain-containing protein [Streptosporangiales bacterium]|nr:helix-turn-helix domain-containing protein [Streptosporangiales bacterium]